MENVEFITKLKINLGFSGFKKILEISKIVKNWYMLPLFKSKIIKKVNITLVNGTFYFLGNDLDYKNFWNSNEAALAVAYKFLIKYSENKLFFDHLIFEYKTPEEFKNTIYMIRENFIYKQYSKLNVKGKVVLDIGGGIGDTAIYFYKNGATKIISLEPNKFAFEIATKNIKLNKLKNIIFLNIGLGQKNRKIKLDHSNYNPGYSLTFKSNLPVYHNIKFLSLDVLCNTYNLKNSILKMDIEGLEYKIILNSTYSTLRNFDEIIIEYHNGYKNLKNKLKNSGFYTKLLNTPILTENGVQGLLFAKKTN